MPTSDFTSDKDVQLVPGALYGLRAFRVTDAYFYNFDRTIRKTRTVLKSPTEGRFTWRAGEMRAECGMGTYLYDPGDHTVGQADCSCGFYSYHTMTNAKSYMPNGGPFDDGLGMLGVIEAYGRVTLGNKGMRSEKAKIVGLVAPRKLFGGLRHKEHEAILEQFPDAKVFRTLWGAAEHFHVHGRPKVKS